MLQMFSQRAPLLLVASLMTSGCKKPGSAPIEAGSIAPERDVEELRKPEPLAEFASTEQVSLRFGWPEDLHARVRVESRSRARSTGEDPTDMRRAADLLLEVTGFPDDELLVEFEVLDESDRPPEFDRNDEIGWRKTRMWAPLVVSRAGAHLRVYEVEDVSADLRAALAALPASGDDREHFLDSVTSEPSISTFASGWWNALVGNWIGADLYVGKVYSVELPGYSQHHAPRGEVAYRPKLTFQVVGREECMRDTQRSCVRIRLHTRTPEVVAKQNLLAQLDGANVATVDEALLMHTVDLLTEPDTLIPHEFSLTKFVRYRTTVIGPSGPEPHVNVFLQEDRSVFSYISESDAQKAKMIAAAEKAVVAERASSPRSTGSESSEMAQYVDTVIAVLSKAWAVPADLNTSNLADRVTVYVRLDDAGHILEYKFESKSGVEAYDESIANTLIKFTRDGDGTLPLPANEQLRTSVLQRGMLLQGWRFTGDGERRD